MKQDVYLGIDVGSTTVKVAGVDGACLPVGEPVYLRHDSFETPLAALQEALSQFLATGDLRVASVGTTGSGRELTRSLIGADLSRTEIVAHATGVTQLVRMGLVRTAAGDPVSGVGTLLEIGGQDSKVIIFGPEGLPSFFQMNSICSAGTGEFLKQLSDEAGIHVSEFGPLALQGTEPAEIDSTCTVFARRDFRHLTQKGVPLPDRLMGICQSLVRNYLRNVVPEGAVRGPVLFQGGVAYNQGVRMAFEQQLGLPVVVPPMHGVIGALGMAVLAREHILGAAVRDSEPLPMATGFRDDFSSLKLESRVCYCHGCANACELTQPQVIRGDEIRVLETAGGRCEGSQNPHNVRPDPQSLGAITVPVLREPLPAERHPALSGLTGPARTSRRRSSAGRYFAGLDGGSRGTKYALIRSQATGVEVVAVGSLSTGGDAIAACMEALNRLRGLLPPGADLGGVGTTGSAGELFRDLITTRDRETSDLRSTEILAHYAWASHRVPQVGTVIDIGGNDAKIITVKPGGLDFAMNDKCAAGTGAFLEAVARRFHIPLEQYAEVALSSHNPARIAGRCAVFGESDVVHKSRMGFGTPDLLSGVAYSICRTYFTDVGRGRQLRVPIVAQGGVFLNKAVQEAFRKTLGLGLDEFRVAEDTREVVGAGALGAALLSKGMYEQGYDSAFKGFAEIAAGTYRTVTTQCRHARCHRTCDGVVVLLENERPVAGYRSIDCPLGFFDGMAANEAERWHMASLIEKKSEVINS
ncbi:MAG TPA: acyl-CoA dehydratase activase [Symbiobacteriaceae bacterium]|nr:acyl-CoA dehydratase activase [Symbiobacteriaceae bacterium]